MNPPTLWDAMAHARVTDPDTSREAAKPSRQTQLMRLLEAYRGWTNLTDEEATERAGIAQGWKRCSDLRRLGYIEDTTLRKVGSQGKKQMVCCLTDAGAQALGVL